MKTVCENKKARFDYFLDDFYTAGLVLQGSEVKSIRGGHMSLVDTFIFVKNGELFLKNCYIKNYEKATSFAPDERKDRKLLLNKAEINKIIRLQREKGYTIVATKAFLTDKGLVKLEIALARGKKNYDKRETLKKQAITKEINKQIKFA